MGGRTSHGHKEAVKRRLHNLGQCRVAYDLNAGAQQRVHRRYMCTVQALASLL